MAINLTLNDFRSVLGNVNDGNIVFKQDQSGIEKANYGAIRTYNAQEPSVEENARMRKLFAQAIEALGGVGDIGKGFGGGTSPVADMAVAAS